MTEQLRNSLLPRTRGRRPITCAFALMVLGSLIGTSVEAGERHAKLSQDLEQQLASGSSGRTSVILDPGIASRHGLQIKKRLERSEVVEVTPEQLAALANDPTISHLSGDARVQGMLATAVMATGADQVRGGISGLPGYTGRGVGVAVLDSGCSNHASIRKSVIASFDFTNSKTGLDEYGHGTFVASIIAGQDDQYSGIAPGAHIVCLKVLDDTGSGDTSDVIAALDFLVANGARYNIGVINMSLGHPVFESYRVDPLGLAVENAVKAGYVVVTSAGNNGKTKDGRKIIGGIVSPCNTPASLCVGASNTKGTAYRSDDEVASYSSTGPTPFDGLLKPEMVAPGNKIVAAAALQSKIVQDYPERIVSGGGQNSYIELSGTSWAAAMVSGAAALLRQAQPSLTPADVKLALQITSSRLQAPD